MRQSEALPSPPRRSHNQNILTDKQLYIDRLWTYIPRVSPAKTSFVADHKEEFCEPANFLDTLKASRFDLTRVTA